MGERGMDELSKQGLFGGKKLGNLGFCEHCVYGKYKRVYFKPTNHNTKGSLTIYIPIFGGLLGRLHLVDATTCLLLLMTIQGRFGAISSSTKMTYLMSSLIGRL